MTLDPELAPFLELPFPNNFDDIEWSRHEQSKRTETEEGAREVSGVTWADQLINVEPHNSLRVRMYRPVTSQGLLGAVLFFHGGAFVFGDLESEHQRCLLYCQEAPCVVVSVEYSLAPEHPFPAAFNQGVGTLKWIHANANTLGVDATRIAVCGVSAGGALASSVALSARDTDDTPVCAQLLIYPVTDSHADTPSMNEFFNSGPFDGEMSQKMWSLYVSPTDAENPYASIARATNLRNIPPTYIVTAHIDPLRDEGLDYALALIDAGNDVELHHFPGTYHGFDGIAPLARVSQRALQEQCGFLSNQFMR